MAKATVLTLGLSSPAFALATGTNAISLKAEEQELLSEFHQLLAGYSHSAGVVHKLTAPKKINHSASGVLDFVNAAGDRISLTRIKGRLVARLY